MAAGLSLNGFGGAGGIGKRDRRVDHDGETELDVHGYRAWRFGAAYRDPRFAAAAAREVYRYYYRLRYPLDTDEWGRPTALERRCTGACRSAGAVFGAKNGWERADHFEPGTAVAARRAPTSAVRLDAAALVRGASPRSTRRSASGSG